jgi:hypothetical protein
MRLDDVADVCVIADMSGLVPDAMGTDDGRIGGVGVVDQLRLAI